VQDVGERFLVVRNRTNGDIFLYDRSGKAIRKINRKGQGAEEYLGAFKVLLDERKEELFVSDIHKKTVFVYNLYGEFKRSFAHRKDNGSLFYLDLFDYDEDHLIGYDSYRAQTPFVLLSKQDGRIIRELEVPFEKKLKLQQRKQEGETTYTVSPGPYRAISPFKGEWILTELSTDTIYTLLPDQTLHPFLVRTPAIGTMNPEVFLLLRLLSDRYLFLETIKNTYNFDTKSGFERTFLVYDRQEKNLFPVYRQQWRLYRSTNRTHEHPAAGQSPDRVLGATGSTSTGRRSERGTAQRRPPPRDRQRTG
jgi:hypothetical protein